MDVDGVPVDAAVPQAAQTQSAAPAASTANWRSDRDSFRRVQRVRPALSPHGDAKTDFDILHLLARTMGADLGCAAPAAAMAEIAALTPTFAGISHDRLDRDGPLHWPCRSPDHPGGPVLYLDRFDTTDGRAALAARPYLSPGEQPAPSTRLCWSPGAGWSTTTPDP